MAQAAPRVSNAELAARLPPSPPAGFGLPVYAAAAARTQAARSEDEDNAAYNGRHYRPPSGEVGALVDLEAKGPSQESDEDDSDDDDSDANDEEPDGEEPDAEEPDEKVPDDKEPDDEESGDPWWLALAV